MKYVSNSSTKQKGFALVLALSLMAFVLVLLLSITTLVRVETSASDTALSKLEAQQNALLGAYIAVGELQRAAGPDQRVTARADILDSDPDTLDSDGVANPHWLAVYKTVEPGQERQPLEALRNWATDGSSTERIDWLVSSTAPLRNGGLDPAGTDAVTLNGGSADDVVTLATFADPAGAAGASREVRAGKVPVLAGGNTSGRFAWWVADESAKFRINQTKETTVLNGVPFEPRWALMAPQQSNPSNVPELATFDPSNAAQQDRLKRSFTPESFQLVNPSSTAWSDWAGLNQDAFTLLSQSIPVDVTQGRLKEDLTVYLETSNSGLNDTGHIVRGGSSDSNYNGRLGAGSFAMDYAASGIPQFGLLKSWYEDGMQLSGFDGGTAPAAKAHAPDQHGIHPVVMRTAVYFGLAYEPLPSSDGSLPDNIDARMVYLVYPKFTLWNPHNVPIAPAKYVVQVRIMQSINTQINVAGTDIKYGARNSTQGVNYEGNLRSGKRRRVHDNFFGSNMGGGDLDGFQYLTFVIDSTGFAPGETLVFTGEDRDPKTESLYSNVTVQNISDDFSQHNLLVNQDEGFLGFFYIKSNNRSLNNRNASPQPIADGDIFQTAIYFQDVGSSTPDRDRSLTTKLYRFNSRGDLDLLEFIDLQPSDTSIQSEWDWESINSEGFSSTNEYSSLNQTLDFRSLSSILANPGTATFERGHGYYLSPMDPASTKNQYRSFARYNFAVSEKGVDEPFLEPSSSGGANDSETIEYLRSGGMYVDAAPATEWFDVEYQAEIPSEDNASYQNVPTGGGAYNTLGGFGLYQATGTTIPPQGTIYPIYDRVRSETGLLSLGFLKNVNFAQRYWQPTFSFGNSEAHTHVDRELVQQTHVGTNYFDLSYLLNESLWDRFFLSTIPQTGAFTPSSELVLPNSNHRITPRKDGSLPASADLRGTPTGFQTAAASVAVEGAFNVNSTSVEAWRMFLSSHLGERVATADGALSNDSGRVPFGSKLYPLTGEAANAVNEITPSSPEVWSGLRALSVAEIDALAAAMVEEVKRRGPFLSLADFVNRRLIDDGTTIEEDYLGLKGALQAAIDKVSVAADSNAPLNAPFYQGDLELTTDEVSSIALDPEHEAGSPTGVAGSRMYGAPGFLTQADVLSSLGSALTVRGDTFTIRTYGEALAGVSGNVNARAWCEVVVQRIAEPVDPADSIVQPTGRFGRSFKILSQRWLTDDDII